MKIGVSAKLKAKLFGKGSDRLSLNIGFQRNAASNIFYLAAKNKDSNGFEANTFIDGVVSGQTGIGSGIILESAGVLYAGNGINNSDLCNVMGESDSRIMESGSLVLQTNIAEKMFTKNVGNGICLWLFGELGKINILNGLVRLGYSQEQKIVLLLAFSKTDNTDVWGKFIWTKLPDIKLFDIFDFVGVELKYRMSGESEKEFAVSGTLSIQISDVMLSLSGNLLMTDKGYTAQLCAAKTESVVPFKSWLRGLSFSKLQFMAKHIYEDGEGQPEVKEYYLCGQAELAGVQTNGEIYFGKKEASMAKVSMAKVELCSKLSLAELWSNIFPGAAAHKDSLDIILDAGSEVYYCTQQNVITESGRNYDKGFAVYAVVKMKLIESISGTGTFRVDDNTMNVTILLNNNIDFKLLKIKEPKVEFSWEKTDNSEKTTVRISGGIELLGRSIEETQITCVSDENKQEFTINISVPDDVPDDVQKFLGEKLTLIYDTKEGFSISGVNALDFQDSSLNFTELFDEFMKMKGNKCKEIKSQKKVSTKFYIKPAIEGGVKKVCIKFDVTMKIFGEDNKELLKRELAAISIEVEENLKLADLPNKILKAMQELVTDLIDSLFKNFDTDGLDELKELLEYMFAEELESYVMELVCRKLLNKEQAENLVRKPGSGGSGGSESSGSGSSESSGSGSNGSGGSGSGGSGGSGGGGPSNAVPEIAAGGAAGIGFSSSDLATAAAAAGSVGMVGITLIGSGDSGENGENDDGDGRLPCPEFQASIDDKGFSIQIYEVKNAVGYKLDFVWWKEEERQDYMIDFNTENAASISLLEIPLYGNLYVAVRAIHRDEELSSDWSDAYFAADITTEILAHWANNCGYCIQDCYKILQEHKTILEDEDIHCVLDICGKLKSPETIATEHFKRGDSRETCIEHMNEVYPYLSLSELQMCLQKAGYVD